MVDDTIRMWQMHPGEKNSTLDVIINGANLYVLNSTKNGDAAYQVQNDLMIPEETIRERMSKLTQGLVTVKAEGASWGLGTGQHITITNFTAGDPTDYIKEIILSGLPSGTHGNLSWNFTAHNPGDEVSLCEKKSIITKLIESLNSQSLPV